MATVQITLSDEAKAYVDAVVSDGGYADISDFIAALIQADEAKLQWLRVEIQKGLDSGASPYSGREIVDRALERARRKCA